jgi:hypothetical protein
MSADQFSLLVAGSYWLRSWVAPCVLRGNAI